MGKHSAGASVWQAVLSSRKLGLVSAPSRPVGAGGGLANLKSRLTGQSPVAGALKVAATGAAAYYVAQLVQGH